MVVSFQTYGKYSGKHMEVYHTEIFILLYLMRKCHLLLWVNYSHVVSFATAAVKAADNPRREGQDPPGQK